MAAQLATVTSIDALLQDPRLWRGQDTPAPARSPHPTGFGALDDALPTAGWPEAALVDILFAADGLGELQLLMPALAALSSRERPILVVAPPYRPYAPAWRNAGVDLRQLHVLDANPKDALWAMEQALRAGCCGAVLGWPLQADDTALRRLQVAAESGRTPGFVFRPLVKRESPSPAPLRLSLRGTDGGPELRMLKCRGALPPARPIAFHPHLRS